MREERPPCPCPAPRAAHPRPPHSCQGQLTASLPRAPCPVRRWHRQRPPGSCSQVEVGGRGMGGPTVPPAQPCSGVKAGDGFDGATSCGHLQAHHGQQELLRTCAVGRGLAGNPGLSLAEPLHREAGAGRGELVLCAIRLRNGRGPGSTEPQEQESLCKWLQSSTALVPGGGGVAHACCKPSWSRRAPGARGARPCRWAAAAGTRLRSLSRPHLQLASPVLLLCQPRARS